MGGESHKCIIQNRNMPTAGSTNWSFMVGCIENKKRRKRSGEKIDSYANVRHLFTECPEPTGQQLSEWTVKPESLQTQLLYRAQHAEMHMYGEMGTPCSTCCFPCTSDQEKLRDRAVSVNHSLTLKMDDTEHEQLIDGCDRGLAAELNGLLGNWVPVCSPATRTITRFGFVSSVSAAGDTTCIRISRSAIVYLPIAVADNTDLAEPVLQGACPDPTRTWTCKLIQASDIKGYYCHLGMEDGGNLTCPCPFCNCAKADFQAAATGKGYASRSAAYQQRLYERVMKEGGDKLTALERKNVKHDPFLCFPIGYTCMPFLHCMLGIVDNHRKMILTTMRKVDTALHHKEHGEQLAEIDRDVSAAEHTLEGLAAQRKVIDAAEAELRQEAKDTGAEYKKIAKSKTNTARQDEIVAGIRFAALHIRSAAYSMPHHDTMHAPNRTP